LYELGMWDSREDREGYQDHEHTDQRWAYRTIRSTHQVAWLRTQD
jgi:hypothetical protein